MARTPHQVVRSGFGSSPLSRRRVLALLGGGAALPLLAACGGSAAVATSASTGSAASAAPTTTLAASAASTSAASTSAASSAAASSVAATTSSAAPAVASSASSTSTASAAPAATTASASAAAPARGTTAIEFWQWGAGYQAGFEKWASQFNAQHSGMAVKVVQYATNNNEKITVAEAGGTGPEVFLSDSDGFKNRAFAGLEASIDDLAAQDKTVGDSLKQMLPSAVQWYTYNGKRYGLPWDYSAGVVIYNVDQLRAAGLTPPAELSADPAKWTWDIFQQYAAKLTVKKGEAVDRAGAYLGWGGYENSWYSLALAHGGSYYNSTLDQCTIGSPACVEALDYAAAMAKSGVIATPTWWKTITTQYGKPMEPFTAGKVAMQYTGDWNFKAIEQAKTSVTWDATFLPYDPKTAKTGNWSNLRGLVMNPAAKRRDESFQFLAYLTTAEVQDTITAAFAEVPMRLDSAQKTYLVGQVAGPPAGRTTLKPALDATMTDGTPFVNEDDAWSLMSTAAQSVYDGKTSAADSLTSLQQQMNAKIQAARANSK